MTLKQYLNQKPIEECFDLIPSVYKGRDLHEYKDAEINLIKTDHDMDNVKKNKYWLCFYKGDKNDK